eukprot:CAMPEP_0178971686 /NCGR_PEP_ID=MMETSP0789-20121207/20476_1 /TAXON_ID=3005 /ORGANISM="Rhizosolenia setigera, Strain CCMP 1694" /LENGTH=494 /DNA_ID=CAMNT_0020658811 /DNA_START=594 /DNA_END=2078 /DNA_ORIENTATION=+
MDSDSETENLSDSSIDSLFSSDESNGSTVATRLHRRSTKTKVPMYDGTQHRDFEVPLYDYTTYFRYTVCFIFNEQFDCAENTEATPWTGRGGIARKISQKLGHGLEEARFCFGVAVVQNKKNDDGTFSKKPEDRLGRRCRPWVYSAKKLLSISEYKTKIFLECERVRSLRHGGEWVEGGNGDKNTIYLDDPLTAESNIYESTFDNIWSQAKSTTLEERPARKDHRKAQNPYKSRYQDRWEDEIKKSKHMSKYVCITELIEHMVAETKRVFADTAFAENCFFYHDALALMTAKETREWMAERGYDKMWILPEKGLMRDMPKLFRYWDRPVGNSPELCALDNSLNRDVHAAVESHVYFTQHVEPEDWRKFSFATYKTTTSAYLRIFDPDTGTSPTSERIVQDCEKVLQSILDVMRVHGTIVPELNCRTGKRRHSGKQYSMKKGGGGRRLLAKDDYGERADNTQFHHSIQTVLDEKIDISKKMYDGEGGIESDTTME